MVDLRTATASDLLPPLRRGELGCLELLDAYLARIERLNAPLNAVVTLDAERARERARALDAARARGEPLGVLHGLPMTIKDAYETAGLRTVVGTSAYRDYVPRQTALAVQRLLDAGAVVLGKTNVPSHCSDVQTWNEVFGTTYNPHDLARTPGGSSGGAAVALACGFTALELGSDIGGSIRTPASWTGVYGHKPSYGLVPQRGHVPPAPGSFAVADLNVCGPMARGARDLDLALSVLASPLPEDARGYRLALPPPRHASLREHRVGVWLDEPAFPLDTEVRAALESVVAAVERSGAHVQRVCGEDLGLSLPSLWDDYLALLMPVMLADIPTQARERLAAIAQGRVPAATEMLRRVAEKATQSHVGWLAADARRARYRACFERVFERFDVLLLPVNPVAAILHDQAGSPPTRSIVIDGESRPYMELLTWISPASACYLPATVAPAGRTAGGLPLGVQIVAGYLEDRTAIAFAEQLAQVHGGFEPPRGPAGRS